MSFLQVYLVSARANRENADFVLIGNEAADLDSMASSIAYGYLLSEQKKGFNVLPVMPIARKDFKLRTEAVYVFREAGINPDDLVFLDEVDFDKLMLAGVKLILVDHNRLAPKLEKYHANVLGIIDHHNDEGLYGDADIRILESAGSTASLVGMEFRRTELVITKDMATLLYGTILLDTVNLDRASGRVTGIDIEVVEFLFPLCSLPREKYFNNIQREKFNVMGLGTRDLLRKDYKEFLFSTLRCGVSSVPLSIEQWVERDRALCSGLVYFAETCKLDVLLSMNVYIVPEFKRDLIVYCKKQELYDTLYGYLQEGLLGLTPVKCKKSVWDGDGFLSFYHQDNLGMSRKKLQPLLSKYYEL